MLDLDKVARILSEPVVSFKESQCLRNRYKRSRCERCAASCPEKCISFPRSAEAVTAPSGTRLVLDDARCTGCGRCQAVCPTGAFRVRDLSYNNLFHLARGKETIELACGKSPGTLSLKVPCLLSLDETVLAILALAGPGRVYLDIAACSECNPEAEVCPKMTAQTLSPTAFWPSAGRPSPLLAEAASLAEALFQWK